MRNRKRILALLLAGVLAFGGLPITASAANNVRDGARPGNGVTISQPFPQNLFLEEHNSAYGYTRFRIPALTTAADGTLVAATDIRWDTCNDGGGIDTVVSRSDDEGKNWSYTVANYLGDNGNKFNYYSSAFIDASLVTSGDTIYMACDLYPSAIGLNSAAYAPKTGSTGYDANGNLLLAAATENVTGVSSADLRSAADFGYHLEKKADATAESCYEIKDSDGTAVAGYIIDDHFNIKSTDGENATDTNLFCGDSPYFPYPTDFIYIVKSTDNGATWSAPQLADVKKKSEQTLLIGPGHGMVTSTGRIMFTCYEFTGGDKNSATIYSDDNGATWHRGASVSGISSEAVMTEADGRVYMFVRRQNVYYVSEDNGTTWSEPKSMGITYNSNCQLTALTYSKKVNGKTAILFAAPSDTSGRNSGRIWLGLVQDDGSIQWQSNPYVVTDGSHYAYSCITELKNGDLGLLYEYDDNKLQFEKIAFADVAPDVTAGGVWLTDENNEVVKSAVIKPDQTASYTVNTLEDVDVKVSSSNRAVLDAAYEDGKLVLKVRDGVTGLKQVKVTVTAGDESVVMNITVTDAENYKVIDLEKGETKTITIKNANYADADISSADAKIANVKVDGKDTTETIENTSAQLGTNIAVFNGQKVNLNKCLYTLEAGSGTDTYKVKAMGADGTAIYLGPKASSTSGLPNVTSSQPLITFTKNAADDTFSLMDNSTGGAGKYLYFHHTNASKLHFDRQNTADANCYFEIYTPSDNVFDYDLINGYKKVESTAELKAGSNYLIVTKADANGNRYVLVPSTGTQKYDHVAKLVTETVSSSEQAVLAASDVATFTTDNKKAISDNLYTFKKVDENRYVISGHTADGSTTFLNIGTARIPNRNVSEVIKLQSGRNQTVGFYGTTSNRYLYFWFDTSRLYYDRNSTLAAPTCEFELYKPSENAPADSPIPGYEIVNGVSGVEDGGEYLIASKVSGNYYIMNPTLENINYKHVAKVSDETFVKTAAAASTTITFTGVGNGSTSVKIGDVVYFIAVKEEGAVCDHTSKVVLDAKEATCTEDGYTGDEVCITCGDVVVKGKVINALGHKTTIQGAVEATCTEEGYSGDEVCTVCNEMIKKGDTVKALGHQTEIQGAVEATCTEDGYTGDEVCTVCSEVLKKGEAIKASGHKTTIQGEAEATCTEDGYTGDEICTVCNEIIKNGNVIAAKGHNYVDGTCMDCGQKDPELEATYALRFITVDNEAGWYYANEKGKVDRSYTGVTDNEYGWWYVKDGKVDFNYNDLATNEYGWWKIAGGAVDFNYNGLAANEYGWWKIAGGAVDFNYNGLAANEYGWWKIAGGAVDFNYNGLAANEYGWWKITGGAVDFNYTGLAANEYGWWKIANGAVDFNYNGLAANEYGWWKIVNGAVDFNYNGLAANEAGWWKITNGAVDFNYTGLAASESGWWYVKNGKVDFNYTGLAANEYGWWYLNHGQVDVHHSILIF